MHPATVPHVPNVDPARPELVVGDSVLTLAEVALVTSLGAPTIEAMAARGQFPQPVVLTARRRGWRASTVRAWIESRPVAARGSALVDVTA